MTYILLLAVGVLVGWQRPFVERMIYRARGDYSVFKVYFNDDSELGGADNSESSANFEAFGGENRRSLYTSLLAHRESGLLWTLGGSIARFEVIEGADDYPPLSAYRSSVF